MNDEDSDKLKAALEPSPEAVDRVVAAALTAQHDGARRPALWLALGAAVILIAAFVTHVRRESPFTELLPVAPELSQISKVSNFGTVMLVEGPAGRTLLSNRTAPAQAMAPQASYRIMISKGAVK